jgi:hypothetical protein
MIWPFHPLRPNNRNHLRIGSAIQRLWLLGWECLQAILRPHWVMLPEEVVRFRTLGIFLYCPPIFPTHTCIGRALKSSREFQEWPEVLRVSVIITSPSAACFLHDHLHLHLLIPIVPFFLIMSASFSLHVFILICGHLLLLLHLLETWSFINTTS